MTAPKLKIRHHALLVTAAAALFSAALNAQSNATLLPGGTFYPRVVRLSHGPADTKGRLIASTNGVIFQSTDNGATFTKLGTVPTIASSKEICCATLYELPRTVGTLQAGTLLSAGTYAISKERGASPTIDGTDFQKAEPAIEIYTSTDAGHTWNFLNTPVHGAPKEPSSKPIGQRGLWEPEFELASDGALVIFVSDETDPCCSQRLIQLRTYDGTTWQDKRGIIAMPLTPAARPGMIVSSALPNGHFFITYEICGTEKCAVYSRTSADGWNFGDPASPGTKVLSTTGQYFRHAPSNIWAPTAFNTAPATPSKAIGDRTPAEIGASASGIASRARGLQTAPTRITNSGEILLIGQILYEANDTVSPENGRVLFRNADLDGTGLWTTAPVPIPVPTAYDNFCPNYSSALLPNPDGTVLELASDYNSTHTCITYFRTAPLR